MVEKIFYNVFILGAIISICILPILIFLSKNKYKYLSKNIYKLFLIILLLLFLPINTLNFSKIKTNFEAVFETKQPTVMTTTATNNSEIIENFVTKTVVNQSENTINVKSNMLYEVFKVLPYIWLGILLIILVSNLLSYLCFLHKLNLKYIDTNIQKISIDIGLNKKVLCYTSKNIFSPMSIGFFKSKIILPDTDLIDSNYEAILKHELFHIKNKDIFCKLLLLILNCIYWFNPIIYNFTNQFNEILELNCDENVLNGQSDAYRTHYAEILLNQIEKNRNQKYSFSLNFANRRKNIMNRFSNIIDKSNKKGTIRLATVLTVLLAIALILIISIPTINFATMPELKQDEGNNDVSLDIKTTEQEPNDTKETEPILVADSEENAQELSLTLPIKEYTTTAPFYEGIHKGIDLAALNGTSIYACADGIIKQSSYDGGYGNRIVIEHENGLQTSYSQCSKLLVNEGDTVKAGEEIAKVGSTGNSTGPHLHFEIIENGNVVDPENYLSF